MAPRVTPVFTPEGLENLAAHKYVSGLYTPLDNLLNPHWASACELLPRWLAPNAVTLLGMVPMALSFGMTWSASPTFAEAVPRSVSLMAAVGLFIYQTLDALDGKQARRTNSSSPVGQLFDHGCDALACITHHSTACLFMLPGPTRWMMTGMIFLQTSFFVGQWMEHHTGVLQTSMGPVGVTEVQFGLIAAALAACAAGRPLQEAMASQVLGLSLPGGAPLTLSTALILGWVVFTSVLIFIALRKTTAKAADKGGFSGVLRALWHLSPVLALDVMALAAWSDDSYAHSARKISLLTGLVKFFYTAQMILSTMAGMRFRTAQLSTLLPYAAVALLSRVLAKEQMNTVLEAAIGLNLAWVFFWIYRVLRDATARLDIYVFCITKRPAAKES